MAQHADRLTGHQLPAYAPDDHPIEHLWRTVKREKTHHRSFPTFDDLLQAVERGLTFFQQHPAEVQGLMGTHLDHVLGVAHAA